MKKSSEYGIYAKAARMLPVCAMAIMATGCTDDTLHSSDVIRDDIQFKVCINDIWNQGAVSRSDTTARPKSIELSDETHRLYLVPSPVEETKGMGRGCVLEDESLASFGVFAKIAGSESGPDYMYNEEVTSKNSWAPVKSYLWPGEGKLHINAYVPYVSEPQSDEGITSLPAITDKGDLAISYKVPAIVDEQEDLMWSTPCDASKSPCQLTFNHALTAIRIFSGSELPSCTIKEISIKNVLDEGTLDLETGEWSDTDGSATYTLTDQVTLTASEGNKYVTPGIPVVDGDNTFILLPQTLGSDATLSMTIDFNGTTTVLTASLDGQEWGAGKVLNYRISASPEQQTLNLDVTGKFESNYYLGTDTFTVKSSLTDGSSTTPIKWIAEFVDDNGNVIDRPQWISDFPVSGTGDTHCSVTTVLQDPRFVQLSPESQILQAASDINQTSGHTPYNLASSTGDASVENTANCYVINAPGIYSLPLVYGNAIKNSASNPSAYTSSSHNRYALKQFVNHLNNAITDPYIYNNQGCTPASANLLWEAELGLVKNVSLSADKKSLTFQVGHSTIRQGNAVVAVYDASGAVMWSWHIWVTDYVPGTGTVDVNVSGKNYGLYPRCVGQVNGGDITDFEPRSVNVRFTQTDVPEGLTPLTKTLVFTQKGITINKGDRYTYYQWGRKDPMVPDAEEWYDATHQEIRTLTQMAVESQIPSGMSLEQCWTLDPQVFWTSPNNHKFSYNNLWNTNLSATAPVKTVYDPSPVGSMIPIRNIYHEIVLNGTLTFGNSSAGRTGFIISTADGTLWFPPLGYRSGNSGNTTNSGSMGEYWSSESNTTGIEAWALVLEGNNSTPNMDHPTDPRGYGLGVCPMLEP